MRNLLIAVAVVGMLAAPTLGVINIKLTTDLPPDGGYVALMPGQSTTVHVWAQGTAAGVYSLAGDIVASGPGLTLNANAGSLAFTSDFIPTLYTAKLGTAGTNGGWNDFGSLQSTWNSPNALLGKADYVEVCNYTLTVMPPWNWGGVTLTFAPKTVGGFKPTETDKSGVIGTTTPLTFAIVPEPLTIALLALGLATIRRRR